MTQIKKKAGFTLAEVLVSMAIFSMVMGAVVIIYIKGMQIYRQKGENAADFRKTSIVFENISKDIMCNAKEILYPSIRQNEYPTLYYGVNFIVFSTYDNKIICYQLDNRRPVVWKYLYKNFDKYDPSISQIIYSDDSPKIIAEGIVMLDFMLREDIMQIYIIAEEEPNGKKYKFLTKVTLKAKTDSNF